MKIKILGSGGGEYFPATFCTCEHCQMARKAGGKSLRTLSQTLVNEDLLIDFPADTGMHCMQYGINLGQLQHVLVTHAHSDHYMPVVTNCRRAPFAHNMKFEKLYFIGPNNLETIYDSVLSAYGENGARENIGFVTMTDRQEKKIGNYDVTALRAQHAPELSSLNYIIEEGNKSLLYLVDTGYPTVETLEYLQSRGKIFDCVVMDSTMGIESWVYHMGFADNKALKEELLKRRLADERTRFVITHITHNNAETHDKIETIFERSGIEVAYDGMELLI